ncbi:MULTISPECIES: nucleotidyltransferase family protein [Paenibacillus]|uniref:hypothetical protein n=1 Tax=Paenibacillus TaxID=44249 RepID=UPI0022B90A8D|nr:hypothetical protein [Paenibacillus caseinilyticus]MCZ8520547.1 hypothetical protein [Paenibacillus caseinilyticus]
MRQNDTDIYSRVEGPLSLALQEIGARSRGLGASWLIGGSTGLLLQDVPLAAPPRDLDLYADKEAAALLHQALLPWSTDLQEESETGMYRSILSHYEIAGVAVELVGAFEVRTAVSRYCVEADYLRAKHALLLDIGQGIETALMPLAHELLFNLLRGRPDRYEAIAAVLRSRQDPRELAALSDLLSRNWFGTEAAAYCRAVLGRIPWNGEAGG